MRRGPGKLAGLLALGYAGVLAAVSLLPSGVGTLSGWDTAISPGLQNLLHVPAYGLLVWLVARAMDLRRLRHLALAAAACAAFGGLLECAQAAIPGRFGSMEDMLLNLAGTVAAVPIMLGLRRLGGRKQQGPVQEDAAATVSGNVR